jgi:hypothetical protein
VAGQEILSLDARKIKHLADRKLGQLVRP